MPGIEETLKEWSTFHSICWECKRELKEDEVMRVKDSYVTIHLCFDCYVRDFD
ncbi:hypothetical protein [Halobacillus litoralis]|uniref:hypothetical protein n=1 Tax=Halobacillus litoralis TaxID=45668 RepID=UPI001CFD7A97|nr:hypothetical protein [Halobacillus litoralis]